MSKEQMDPQKLERARSAFAAVRYAKFLGLQLGAVLPGIVPRAHS